MATPSGAEHRDLEARFRKIERKLADVLAAVTRRPKFEVSAGDLTISGGDLVVDGGDFLLLDTDGSTVFKLGPQEHGDRGVSIFREDGAPVLEVSKTSPGAVQAWRMKDSNGTVVVSENSFGVGLGRPRIPLPVHPVAAPAAWGTKGPEVSTTSGTFATLFALQSRRQNPLWAPELALRASDTTTSAEIRVINSAGGAAIPQFGVGGTYLGTLPTGSTAWTELTPALNMVPTINADARFRYEVQVRRTAGAGTVFLAIPESIGA